MAAPLAVGSGRQPPQNIARLWSRYPKILHVRGPTAATSAFSGFGEISFIAGATNGVSPVVVGHKGILFLMLAYEIFSINSQPLFWSTVSIDLKPIRTSIFPWLFSFIGF